MSMQFGKTEEEFVHNLLESKEEEEDVATFLGSSCHLLKKIFFDTYSMGLFLCNKLGQIPTLLTTKEARRGGSSKTFFPTNVTFQDHYH